MNAKQLLTMFLGCSAVACGGADPTASSADPSMSRAPVAAVAPRITNHALSNVRLSSKLINRPEGVDRAMSFGGAGASSFKLKFHSIWFSPNADCSAPVQVMNADTPDYMDLASGGSIGNGTISDGTYKCVILEMSDTVKFTPDAITGTCETQEYSMDVCTSSEAVIRHPDGSVQSCSTGEERLFVYLSVDSAVATEADMLDGRAPNPFEPPAGPGDASHGLRLAAPVVVLGTGSATLAVDTSLRISGAGETCRMVPPIFSLY